MRALVWLPAVFIFATTAAAENPPAPPNVQAGLTIPEVVAALEQVGYSDFDAAESNERTIRLQADTPEGQAATVKYLKATGTMVVVREQASKSDDTEATSNAPGDGG